MAKVEARSVAVVGVAGFVGQHVARHLRERGWDVRGATSPRNRFLLDYLHIKEAVGDRYPVVINLAYPTAAVPLGRKRANRKICDRIASLVAPGATVLHASTLAVFGFAVERPQTCGPIRWRPDLDYVESKVWMENQLVANFASGHRIEVVRLGNVWGPASPPWLCGLATRLRQGLPTLIEGGRYSNVTDVGNVTDYLAFLASRALERPGNTGAGFHHLAELSETPWQRFVEALAGALGVEPVSAAPLELASVRSFVFGRLSAETFRFLNQRPRTGSWVRQILDRLPERAVRGLRDEKKAAASGSAMEDPVLSQVLGCPRQFRSVTDPAWTAPLTLEDALTRGVAWLQRAGFVAAI